MARDFYTTATEPSVTTKYGKVKGYRFEGIYTFFGIPYAKAERFMMPEEPDCWDGLRDARNWGNVCPLVSHTASADMVPRRFWVEGEDCLNLNIWSPDIYAQEKKPVLVWIHGGGYEWGSPFAHTDYDGEELSKYGDCVVVSIAHRLNLLGYLDLSAFGEKYFNSANAGQADLVMALRWIRDNISGFGGDPNNVTICGQSGGGGKVTTLMQTPDADGLFHKAMIMSGVITRDFTCQERDMTALVNAMLKELNLTAKNVGVLEELPYRQLADIYTKALAKLNAQDIYPRFAPKANGYYVGSPTEVGLTEHAKTIPVLVGSVIGEFIVNGVNIPNRDRLTDEEATDIIRTKFGSDTNKVISMYRKAYPDRRLIDLMCVESLMRNATINFANYFAENSNAPIYSYILAYNFEIDGGKPAWHSSDQAFQFHICNKAPFSNGKHSDRIQDQYAGMWINLGRYGTPSGKAFDMEWRPYTVDDPATMVIGEVTELRSGYDAELIDFLAKNYPDPTLSPKDRKKVDAQGRPLNGI